MEYHVYWLLKISCFEFFGDWKYDLFLNQIVNGNMIFTGYWKVLVLNVSRMRNKGLFLSQKVDGKMMFTNYWKVLVFSWTFQWWEISSFLQPKSCWKDDIYLVFLSFPWYFRTWEIWFFVQCIIDSKRLTKKQKECLGLTLLPYALVFPYTIQLLKCLSRKKELSGKCYYYVFFLKKHWGQSLFIE